MSEQHLCTYENQRTPAAMGLQQAYHYHDVVLYEREALRFRERNLCLWCGYPLDNSEPHPLARGASEAAEALRLMGYHFVHIVTWLEHHYPGWVATLVAGATQPKEGRDGRPMRADYLEVASVTARALLEPVSSGTKVTTYQKAPQPLTPADEIRRQESALPPRTNKGGA